MNATPTVTQRRIAIGAILCASAFLLVGLKLAGVTLFPSVSYHGRFGPNNFVPRTDLVDRNGELLARDVRAYDLYVRPDRIGDRRRTARLVAAVTGADEARLFQIFSRSHAYVLALRQIPSEQRDALLKSGLAGLEFETTGKRNYPNGRMTAQVVGVTDMDDKGVSGLELGLEPQLRNADPVGRIETSLDMRVQFVLADEVAAARNDFSAKAAGGLVMDVDSGEVLGLVSVPDFDPNNRVMPKGDTMRNVMVQDVYELGSVFKIFTFAMGTEGHTFAPDEILPIGKGYAVAGHVIHEAEKMPATLSARDVLAQSSNIGTAQIALRSGAASQRAFLSRLGLLQPLKTELPETARPLYPASGHWGVMETATIAFGHGVSVSPLSFAAAAASVVNGGRKITPTFLKRPHDDRGEQVISPATSAAMRSLLRYVVTNGTGRKADVPGYDVGGKTGSAEKIGPDGHYMRGKLMTSFLAVFPIEHPRYLVFVMLDEPHGNAKTYGFALAGFTAAPMAGRVVSRIAPLLGVPVNPATAANPPSKENT